MNDVYIISINGNELTGVIEFQHTPMSVTIKKSTSAEEISEVSKKTLNDQHHVKITECRKGIETCNLKYMPLMKYKVNVTKDEQILELFYDLSIY